MENRWQIWKSYLWAQHREDATSAHNPVLQVYLCKGEYQLLTKNAIYSWGNRYQNFSRIFAQLDWAQLPARPNILVLGLGLGAIPLMLEKKFGKNGYFTCVEIDAEVIRLAEKYVLSALASPLDCICADADVFVDICEDRFDLICMDIFLDDKIPHSFYSPDFLTTLAECLEPNGILIYNKLAYHQKDKIEAREFYKNVFQPIFQQGTCEDVGGNYLLINRSNALRT